MGWSQNVTIRERVIINETKEKQLKSRCSSVGKSKTGAAYYNTEQEEKESGDIKNSDVSGKRIKKPRGINHEKQ